MLTILTFAAMTGILRDKFRHHVQKSKRFGMNEPVSWDEAIEGIGDEATCLQNVQQRCQRPRRRPAERQE